MAEEFECNHCGRVFKRKKPFENHTCKEIIRLREMETTEGKLAFRAWNAFNKHHLHRPEGDQAKFLEDRTYKFFLTLGKSAAELQIHDRERYVDWVVYNVPDPKTWSKPQTYTAWLKHLDQIETPEKALLRSLTFLNEINQNFANFGEIGLSPGRLHQYVRFGQLSPWFLFLSTVAQKSSSKWSEEQWKLLEERVPREVWAVRLHTHREDAKFLSEALSKHGF